MFKLIQTSIICLLVLVFGCGDLFAAWPWGNAETLVTINGSDYSPEDYERWWGVWNEQKGKLPDKSEPFIEWKLLVQEARSMELDQLATYKRKIDVYLKSRTRMHLKYDEVDSQVQQVTEEDIRSRYDLDYSPVRLGISLYFNSLEKATDAYKDISEGVISVEELLHRKPGEGGAMRQQQNIIRPMNFRIGENPIAKAAQGLEVGGVSSPVRYGQSYIVFYFLEQISFDPGDFAKKKKSIKETLIRERQAMLTGSLIAKLKKKYNVQVDEELFSQATADLSGEILNRPIVTTSNGNIPLFLLVKDLKKEARIASKKLTGEQLKNIRSGLLNGMIAEYLITWESLGRHYEEKPPFKWSYEFYMENRLIRELENIMLHKAISVTDEEVMEHYNLHLDQYMGPSIVSIAMLEDNEDIIKKMWKEISVGQDFFVVAKRYYTKVIPIKDVVLEKLSPELVDIIENLSIGEISPPVELGKKYGMVKLINSKPAQPKPLKSVEKLIKQEIYGEKYSGLRQAYIENLLEHSQVDLNQRAWEKLKRKMASGEEQKKQ
jgi:hypothetical protein